MADKKQKPIDYRACPSKITAEIFGCSVQHLGQLKLKGEIKQVSRGKYDLRQVAEYFLQNQKTSLTDLQKAKLKSEQEKARRQKLANDETEGLLIKSTDVADFLNGFTGEVFNFYESAKKSTGADLTNDARKKFFEKLDHARTALASKLEAWLDASDRDDQASGEDEPE